MITVKHNSDTHEFETLDLAIAWAKEWARQEIKNRVLTLLSQWWCSPNQETAMTTKALPKIPQTLEDS
jgi:hypothetical protein